uniref:Uncharacterized protein n=1 Tax=Rhizophora mucronata TaxID=61149 RepID=A0A2P2Q373_RHIMU
MATWIHACILELNQNGCTCNQQYHLLLSMQGAAGWMESFVVALFNSFSLFFIYMFLLFNLLLKIQ